MPGHPVSRLVRFTLADGKTMIFDPSAIGRLQPTPCAYPGHRAGWLPRRQPRRADCQCLTYGDVERYLAQLAARLGDFDCGRCGWRPGTPHRFYAIASPAGNERTIRATRVRALR